MRFILFLIFFSSLCWTICFAASDQICFDLFLESAALATNGSLPKFNFDNHCNDITLTLQSHISPQGNHPLLVGPLLIEIRLKSAFWRKLQPLYCSSVFLKRKTWISINNGPTNRGWSACDKPLSCLTLVQFSQSCILTDFKQNKIMKNAPQINTVSMVFHCNMSKDKKGKINRKGSILMIKSSPRWRRRMCVCGGGEGVGAEEVMVSNNCNLSDTSFNVL